MNEKIILCFKLLKITFTKNTNNSRSASLVLEEVSDLSLRQTSIFAQHLNSVLGGGFLFLENRKKYGFDIVVKVVVALELHGRNGRGKRVRLPQTVLSCGYQVSFAGRYLVELVKRVVEEFLEMRVV